jgi:hypothetical protein
MEEGGHGLPKRITGRVVAEELDEIDIRSRLNPLHDLHVLLRHHLLS